MSGQKSRRWCVKRLLTASVLCSLFFSRRCRKQVWQFIVEHRAACFCWLINASKNRWSIEFPYWAITYDSRICHIIKFNLRKHVFLWDYLHTTQEWDSFWTWFLRSREYTRMGSLEVRISNYPSIRKFCDIQFFVKLDYETPHMTIYTVFHYGLSPHIARN